MVETFDTWLHAVGPLAYVALFLAALLEYVFPPFPGDTVVLLGGVYAVRGEKPWLLVFLAVTAGSLVGAALAYGLGLKLGHRYGDKPGFAERHPELHRLQEKMRARGMWLIAFNRFMPGVRGPLFAAAGAARLPFGRVMLWGAFSALVWNALIMAVGIALGGNAERLERVVQDYNRVALAAVGGAVALFLVRQVWRMRRARSRS